MQSRQKLHSRNFTKHYKFHELKTDIELNVAELMLRFSSIPETLVSSEIGNSTFLNKIQLIIIVSEEASVKAGSNRQDSDLSNSVVHRKELERLGRSIVV